MAQPTSRPKTHDEYSISHYGRLARSLSPIVDSPLLFPAIPPSPDSPVLPSAEEAHDASWRRPHPSRPASRSICGCFRRPARRDHQPCRSTRRRRLICRRCGPVQRATTKLSMLSFSELGLKISNPPGLKRKPAATRMQSNGTLNLHRPCCATQYSTQITENYRELPARARKMPHAQAAERKPAPIRRQNSRRCVAVARPDRLPGARSDD
jgi:hypothetical protein